MEENITDVTQRLDVIEAIIRSVIDQENKELVKCLSEFKAENVQWVLNKLSEPMEVLADALYEKYEKLSEY